MSTVIVLGGDGFCGWPTSLRLAKQGYRVVILDNFSRRAIDLELGTSSLAPVKSLQQRLKTWNQVASPEHPVVFENIDLSREYERLCRLFEQYEPQSVVHLAELKSAPYSMRDPEHSNLNIQTNIAITSNVLNAIARVDPAIHLVHLGTMGVYGYGTFGETVVPEGYIDVEFNGTRATIVHPYNPGSVYHMTKCLDNQMFHTYVKLYGLKITDLHQGIVWGFETEETAMHPDLINRLDYDSEYGTVLNRLLVQAAHRYPLTIYGSGGQTRAFINIRNTVDCICLAIKNSDFDHTKVRILNQMTECLRLSDLAALLERHFGASTGNLENPRQEAAENPLAVSNQQFLDLGLDPFKLDIPALTEMINYIQNLPDQPDWDTVKPVTYWPSRKLAKSDSKN